MMMISLSPFAVSEDRQSLEEDAEDEEPSHTCHSCKLSFDSLSEYLEHLNDDCMTGSSAEGQKAIRNKNPSLKPVVPIVELVIYMDAKEVGCHGNASLAASCSLYPEICLLGRHPRDVKKGFEIIRPSFPLHPFCLINSFVCC
ncbi:hypothetical protein CDAR_546941 [Caerostris darwini]|uniref:C2H2-type domain-containing protein n=1 Tax=Caerostris darwini TaxID=1538125 RepID=A0AAV4SU57_9ARAC|nr:hypothetical protein CDAR_546941 [Caerostris darwini]